MSTCTSNIVVEWLRSLQLGQYADSFLDNGYDDLEICKQVGDPDLDAIGVFNPNHRQLLLQSVRSLREEGAASVYFTLEETAAAVTFAGTDTSSTRSSSNGVRSACSDKEHNNVLNSSHQIVNDSPLSSSGSVTELGKYLDEYEEGKAELVRIPKLQLKLLLKDKLLHDGIRLSCQPYSTSNGERGYLEGLASRYADRFNTHYQDVLEHLEELRRREWEELSPRMRVLPSAASTPGTPPFPGPLLLSPVGSSQQHSLYAPGKYSLLPRVFVQPSSCLSDKEEDEIYGFGYGIYGKQMLQRQHRAAAGPATTSSSQPPAVPIYQSCLSPRSAYFYEFPPSDQGTSSKKKTTTFSRLLRGLKPHRKDKASSPTARGCKSGALTSPASRVGTPEGLCEVSVADYERLRFLQMNGAVSTSFEETIQRLKMQEALKKKERFHKEQEEILRDIRHGLMQVGLEGGPSGAAVSTFPAGGDDTYMYDDEVRGPPLHWYDEPPYESDPEDFLMGGLQPPLRRPNAALFQNGRVCFTMNVRSEASGEGVISLRSAGDISVPRGATRLPKRDSGDYSRSSKRESGDYAGSEVSRLSTASVETEHEVKNYRTLASYKGNSECRTSEDGLSPCSHSSEEEPSTSAASHARVEGSTGSLVGRMRGLRQDVQRKISRLRQAPSPSPALQAHSSAESLPSGSGSSTQALVPGGSSQSLVSPEEVSNVPVIGKARALVDYTLSPYDKDALKFKKGEVIDVIAMNPSGLWKGRIHNRVGTFKFINVELLCDNSSRGRSRPSSHKRGKPKSVEELLHRMNMEAHISVFILNGYEDLELFKELEEADLDFLGIRQPEHRAKILTAVQLLHDYDAPDTPDSDEAENSSDKSSFQRLQFPRDSGCYASSSERQSQSPRHVVEPQEQPNNLDTNNEEAAKSPAPTSPAAKKICAATAEYTKQAATVTQSRRQESEEFHPNIPVTEPTFDFKAEYDKLRGKLEASLINRGSPIRTRKVESGEAIPLRQLTSEIANNARCLSEKSSDSGMSSSSRSPPPPPQSAVTSSPTLPVFGCAPKPNTPNILEKPLFQ